MNKFKKYLKTIRLQYCSLISSYAALVILNAVSLIRKEACEDAMKRTFRIAIQVCILVTLCLCSSNSLIAQGGCPNIVGTWEYQLEKRKGLFMATETHAMWLILSKDLGPFENERPTQPEKVEAYEALSAAAMTHTCEGNTVTAQFLYQSYPNATGNLFMWEYEIDGDGLIYRTLNKDGSRRSEGRMRRVKD